MAAETSTQSNQSKKDRSKMTPEEAKRDREISFLLVPKDFRNGIIKSLMMETGKLATLAEQVGASKAIRSHTGEDDASLSLSRKQYKEFLRLHLLRIKSIARYHQRLYQLCHRRVARILGGNVKKSPNTVLFRNLATYKPNVYDFIKEASNTLDTLKFTQSWATFNAKSPLNGILSQTMVSQFLLAYVASHRRYNPLNGQYIQPDELMLKFFGDGIRETLLKFADKFPKKAADFPGNITFCHIQSILNFYKIAPVNPAEEERLTTLKKDDKVRETLSVEFQEVARVRAIAVSKVRSERVDQKPSSKKKNGERESSALARARKLRRTAQATAAALRDAGGDIAKVAERIAKDAQKKVDRADAVEASVQKGELPEKKPRVKKTATASE